MSDTRTAARQSLRRPRTCYHEAGHCLARWYFSHWADHAVVLTPEQVRAGDWPMNRKEIRVTHCEGVVIGYDIGPNPYYSSFPSPPSQSEETRMQVEHSLAVETDIALVDCSIGIVAEARYTGQSTFVCALSGGSGDMDCAKRLLDMRFSDSTKRATADVLRYQRARALVRSPQGWNAISAVATALLAKGLVEWDEIDALHQFAYQADQPSRRDVYNQWPWSLETLRKGDLAPSRRIG